MPLVKRLIEPIDISRKKVASEVKNELECVSNNTLSCVVQQLSSLSRQSEDLFGELFSEVFTVAVRSTNLSARIEGLKQKICLLNPTDEEVLLQEINQRKPFKSSSCRDQNLIAKPTRPFSIDEAYKLCEMPPALNKLNVFREDGKESLKFYTNPGYFAELWVEEIKASQLVHKKHKHHRATLQASAGHQPQRGGHSGTQKVVRTPKNRLEQYKQLKHGPEFVEKAKKVKTAVAGGADNSVANVMNNYNNNNYASGGSHSSINSPSSSSNVVGEGMVASQRDDRAYSNVEAILEHVNFGGSTGHNANSPSSDDVHNNKTSYHNNISNKSTNSNITNNINNNKSVSPLYEGDDEGGRLNTSSPVSFNQQQHHHYDPQQQQQQQQHYDPQQQHYDPQQQHYDPQQQQQHQQHYDPKQQHQQQQQIMDTTNEVSSSHGQQQHPNAKHNNNNTDNCINNTTNTTPTHATSRPLKHHFSSTNHVRPSAPPPAPPVANNTLKRPVNQEKSANDVAAQHLQQPGMSLQEEMMKKLSIKHPNHLDNHQEKLHDNHHDSHHDNHHDNHHDSHQDNHPDNHHDSHSEKSNNPTHHFTHHHHHGSYKYDLPPPPSPPPSLSDHLDDDAIPPPPTLLQSTDTTTNDTSPSYNTGVDNDDDEADSSLSLISSQKTPSARDSRSDLLSAIREGIQLRRVEQTRQRNENKTARKEDPGGLDVQSIMEAAFEMRRKVLEEENNEEEEEEEAEEESNWSD